MSPAGDAAIDKRRIAFLTYIRPQPQPLHHAGAHPFDQSIGAGDQIKQNCLVAIILQIKRDRAFAALEYANRHSRARIAALLLALDQNDICTHIGEMHPAKGSRTDPFDLDNADSGKRPLLLGHYLIT